MLSFAAAASPKCLASLAQVLGLPHPLSPLSRRGGSPSVPVPEPHPLSFGTSIRSISQPTLARLTHRNARPVPPRQQLPSRTPGIPSATFSPTRTDRGFADRVDAPGNRRQTQQLRASWGFDAPENRRLVPKHRPLHLQETALNPRNRRAHRVLPLHVQRTLAPRAEVRAPRRFRSAPMPLRQASAQSPDEQVRPVTYSGFQVRCPSSSGEVALP